MRVNRIKHASAFVVIPNAIAQHRTLSLAARGLLAFLLSLPDGIRINVRMIADEIPGLGKRGAAKALDEIEAAGYYVRTTTRNSAGRLTTATAVYDTPQDGEVPSTGRPGTGESGSNPVKNPLKETTPLPTLPERLAAGLDLTDITALGGEGREGEFSTEDTAKTSNDGNRNEHQADDDTDPHDDDRPKGGKPAREVTPHSAQGSSVATVVDLLSRVRQRDARLLVSERDMPAIAGLVATWRDRGASDGMLLDALTVGLPVEIRSPGKLLMSRLTAKMPAEIPVEAVKVATPATRMVECGDCRNPVRVAGLCGDCRTSAQPKVTTSSDEDPALTGAALARRLMAERMNKAA